MNITRSALRGGRLFLHTRPCPLPPRRTIFQTSVRFARSTRTATEDKEERWQTLKHDGPLFRWPETAEEMKALDKELERPLSEEEINDPDAPQLSIYEEDPTSPTGERLVQHIRTPAERRKHNDILKMHLEARDNPNYDDRELNRYVLDEMIKDPEFTDMVDDIKDIKENWVMTKQQEEQMLAEANKKDEAEEAWWKDQESQLQLYSYDSVQALIDDPDFEYAREELAELQDNLPEMGSEEAEYSAALDKVLEKVGDDPNFQQAMAELQAQFEKEHEEILEEEDTKKQLEEMSQIARKMEELMGVLGKDDALDNLEEEFEQIISGELDDDDLEEETRGREMSFEELSKELLKFAEDNPEGGVLDFTQEGDGEPVDAELEAKVDQIMKDPKLMEKLMYIQKVITEEQQKKEGLDTGVELAPDPSKLEPHRIASIKQRMQVARSDPEHRAAMQALCVSLLPPFNIAPALRVFNEAIQYAYVGANDDIRRILWRAYTKARSLPTFLQNLSDDAWDMMYYSQAVTWKSNQNREDHLKLLLRDLRSVDKDGPPTHPSVIAEMQKQ